MKSFIYIERHKVGYFLWSLHNSDLYIHMIDIYLRYRGKGNFKELMREIKKLADIHGCSTISLQPEPQDKIGYFNTLKRLQELYSKHGFRINPDDSKYMICEVIT